LKKYKAIFFDWDGTAVTSRKAPVDAVVAVMRPLLDQGVKLAIISGTTMENIAGGRVEEHFTKEQLSNLYLGIGRAAYNYTFVDGKREVFASLVPQHEILSNIHRICFDIHMELLERYQFHTDIVFSRPNYCKIDLMVDNQRGDQLFLQENELDYLKNSLNLHGIHGGIKYLMSLAAEIGAKYELSVVSTCDAKYLEVGISSKSDNVDAIFEKINSEYNLMPEDCSFWGDEYVGIESDIYGSDSFMRTQKTASGDYYDVSEVSGTRPDGVIQMGGGVERFLSFLQSQV
jgi:hydroxymethylpyrimidine pyrophosphatase-like HAD family hydrolase